MSSTAPKASPGSSSVLLAPLRFLMRGDVIGVIALVVLPGLVFIPTIRTGCGRRGPPGVTLDQVACALEAYHDQFRAYPPDGYDGPSAGQMPGIALGSWPDGRERRFKGSGCLVYFLCRPITRITIKGAVYGSTVPRSHQRLEVVGPFLSDLRPRSYSIDDFEPHRLVAEPADHARVELLDRFGRPIVYERFDRDGRRSASQQAEALGLLDRHWMAGIERLGVAMLPPELGRRTGMPFGYELRSYGASLEDPRDDVIRSSFAPAVGE